MSYDLTHISSVWLPIILDAALKGAIVLGLAAVASLSMRRCSASARHLVWFMVLVCLPVLPILSATLPDWQVLPGWVRLPGEGERPVEAVAVESEPPVLAEVHEPIAPVSVVVEPAVSTVAAFEADTIPPELPVAAAEPIANVAAVEHPAPPAANAPVEETTSAAWQPWTLFAWLAGSLAAGLPILFGTASLWRLQRKSERVADGPILAQLRQLARQLGVRRPVVLLQSGRRSMPMQWGLLRPKLLLPAEADQWPEERRRVVLLHELAHIGRQDCLTQFAARIVCVLYWFNPMVWVALRQLRLERERACDDMILGTGCKPSSYAAHLLAVASGFRAGRLAGFCAIAMARPSALEGRLLAILDPRQNRRRLSSAIVLLVVAMMVGVIIPMAMMRAAEAPGVTGRDATAEASAETADDDTPKNARLAALIEQLGDPEFPQREAAQQELIKMGEAAREALTKATSHTDLEIAARARRCLAELDRRIEARLEKLRQGEAEVERRLETRREQLRQGVAEAVKKSDTAAATKNYLALLTMPRVPLRDCRPAVKFFESNRDFESLAAAYEATAREMKRVIHTPAVQFTRPVPELMERGPTVLVQTNLDGVWVKCKGDVNNWIDYITRKQNQMKEDRLALQMKLGRLYRDKLHQPKRAVAAVEESLYDVEFFTKPLKEVIAKDWPPKPEDGEHPEIHGATGGLYLQTLRELSEMQQVTGDLNGAIETKTRDLLVHLILSWRHRQKEGLPSTFELGSLLRKLPADAPLPPLFWINVLSPENPEITLDLKKDAPLQVYDFNVLAKSGYEFDSLQLTADMEVPTDMAGRGRLGAVDCYTIFEKHHTLARLKWHDDGRQGREEIRQRCKVPPGTGLIRFETQPFQLNGLKVHRITVKATFRKVAVQKLSPAAEAKKAKERARKRAELEAEAKAAAKAAVEAILRKAEAEAAAGAEANSARPSSGPSNGSSRPMLKEAIR